MPVTARIGCVVMASGMSRRYGKDKLLEVLGDREVVLHTAGHLAEAGFAPGDLNPAEGSYVVVETARGQECGEVAARRHTVQDESITAPLKPIPD